MPYWLTMFAGVALPQWDTETPVGTAPTVDDVAALPGGGYYDPYGTMRAPVRWPADEELRATLANEEDATALWAALNALKGLRGAMGELRRRSAGGTQQWCWARLMQVRGARRRGRRDTGLTQEVSLPFQRLSPWYGTLTDSSPGTGASPDGRAELATVGADQDNAVSAGTTLVVYANGNADVTEVQLTVIPAADITDLVWANGTTGSALGFAAVAAGKVLAVDGGAASVMNDGGDALDDFEPPDNDEEWLRLTPGPNEIAVTWAGGGTAQVGVVFRDAWE